MYKIKKVCGKDEFIVKFSKEINLDKAIEYFKEFNLVDKDDITARLVSGNKSLFIYSFGEILFLNFKEQEIKNICDEIDKIIQ